MNDPELIATSEPLQLTPPGKQVEQISESDHLLIMRMEAELLAAQRLQAFVTSHLAAVYGLQSGDTIADDRTIVRASE